ncbi:MAG: OstA-like protein [Flavobacteriaceae bacterium]
MNRFGVALFVVLIWSGYSQAQETSQKRTIEIRQAGSAVRDEALFPGATLLTKKNNERVVLFHQGARIESDRAFFYNAKNFFIADGQVVFTQGDSLRMDCSYLEYSGQTQKAKAWGSVVLKRPDMTLKTDTLHLNRLEQQAYYNTPGLIEDQESRLRSNRGRYFMDQKKYRFQSKVHIDNPEYTLDSEQLDYYTELDLAYLYGKSRIVGQSYEIECLRGFYDLNAQQGYFKREATIYYDNKIIQGDSLYFENAREYAAATNNISITDPLNKSIITGHYGEIFKAKDSAIITRQALAVNIVEQDSLFIHADTLLATGPETKRLLKGFYGVRIYKSDMSGVSDSLHFNESEGVIKLLKKPLTRREQQVFTEIDFNKSNPVMWFGKSQMSGNEIQLFIEPQSRSLDTLKILGRVFVIEKDSLDRGGYNQIKGGFLNGNFEAGELERIDIDKNTEVLYYMYAEDTGELIGIDRTDCSSLNMWIENNAIGSIQFNVQPSGNVFPEKDIEQNERRLEGFIWREEQRPKSKNDLFDEEDLKLPLVPILPMERLPVMELQSSDDQ